VKRLAFAVIARSGVPAIARRLFRRRLLVVCYHGVRNDDAPDRHWLLLPRREFVRQIAFLARHYTVLPIDEALERLREGRLAEGTACVTFDDGYRNNRTLALPVLAEHGVPATIFLATGLVGTDRVIWTVEVDRAFRESAHRAVEVRGEGFAPERILLGDRASRAAAAGRVNQHAKTLSPSARRAFLAPVLSALDVPPPGPGHAFEMLDWDEVGAMERTGLITFGSPCVDRM
jgi:peptidoglycan/xylan/chitin deacetylase (PgdA/CDA1 family)